MVGSRPLGVVIASLLLLLLALLAGTFALFAFGLMHTFSSINGPGHYIPSQGKDAFAAFFAVFLFISFTISAYGLFIGKNWARVLGTILLGLLTVVSLYFMSLGVHTYILALAAYILLFLYLLLSKGAKAYCA